MKKKKKEPMIFDFDGPVVDSFEAAFAVAKMISPTLTYESYKKRFSHNIFVGDAIAPEPKDLSIDFEIEYAAKMAALDLHPGRKDALARLAEVYEFHIISGTTSKIISDYLERHEVDHYFTDVLGSDIERSKVKRFQMLCEKYSINPKDMVFVTDTVGDLREAFEVGVGITIAVCDGFQSRESLEAEKPTHVVNSLMDVPELLLKK